MHSQNKPDLESFKRDFFHVLSVLIIVFQIFHTVLWCYALVNCNCWSMCRCLPTIHPVAFFFLSFAQTIFSCGLCNLDTLALVGITLSVQLPVMEMWLADNQRPFGGYGCFPALALLWEGPHSFLPRASICCLLAFCSKGPFLVPCLKGILWSVERVNLVISPLNMAVVFYAVTQFGFHSSSKHCKENI